jgi:hypothetical protein
MAFTDTMTTETLPFYDRRLRDQIFMSTSFFEYLWQQVDPVPGGLQINEQIAFLATPNAGVFAGGVSELPATFVGNATQATFPPCYYFYSVAIPNTMAILNDGEGMVIDMISAQYENALMSLNNVLAQDAYGDATPRNGAPTLSGLNAIITTSADPAGGAYGGISRIGSSGSFKNPTGAAPWYNGVSMTVNGGAQTFWKGTVNPGSSTVLSWQSIIALMSACTVGPFRPRVMFAGLTAYNAALALMTNIVRQDDLRSNGLGKQGFTGVAFGDVLLVQDDQADAGTIYAVNNLLKFRPWREGFFKQFPWRQPPNALVDIKYGLLVCNLTHSRPNTMGLMSGITG